MGANVHYTAMSLYLEFDSIVKGFHREGVRYALAGGLAMGIYGRLRATEDIDFLVHPEDVEKAAGVLAASGFSVPNQPWMFSNTQLMLRRFMKPMGDSEDFHLVDLLVPQSTDMHGVLDRAESREYGQGSIRVVTKPDLIAMKRRRMSAQDVADIGELERE